MDLSATWNADFIDSQYKRWKAEPEKLSRDWRLFFEGFELAASGSMAAEKFANEDQPQGQSRVQALIYRYRELGHLMACLDPLAACATDHPLLNLEAFNLEPPDLDREFSAGN
ncbi:MAG: 2-oxoglutarate dehydrogenase E1 component, partial [Deltaproteobacteria bacterium]|nr:2-oxoglutarate dehydrogenase E1 component [Deltaproteobacteria bacterium]